MGRSRQCRLGSVRFGYPGRAFAYLLDGAADVLVAAHGILANRLVLRHAFGHAVEAEVRRRLPIARLRSVAIPKAASLGYGLLNLAVSPFDIKRDGTGAATDEDAREPRLRPVGSGSWHTDAVAGLLVDRRWPRGPMRWRWTWSS